MKRLSIFIILCISAVSLFSQENSNIEKELTERYTKEQDIRKTFMKKYSAPLPNPTSKSEADSLYKKMMEIDKDNQNYVSHLLDSVGSWPEGLSPEANQAIFLIIQHGGKEFMNKYEPVVFEAYKKAKVTPSNYAIFKDRLLMYQDKPQIYGSQTMNGYVWPIENEENLDARRAEMGLPTMEFYLKIFLQQGISVVWDKEKTIEEIKNAGTRK